MTTAMFEQQGNSFDVTISGHAGYCPGGPDIVCAACSTLSCTLLQSILALEGEGAFNALHQEVRDGSFLISIQSAQWAQERVETMMSVIMAGFALLAQQYPEHVKLAVKSGEK